MSDDSRRMGRILGYRGVGLTVDQDDVDWLIAEVDRLTADRDRYKAWCAGVMAQESVSVCTTKSGDLMMIERPQPLKENE